MNPILALSTSWCSHRHEDGYAMLREMADLGFAHVELSHGIRIPLVPGILRAVEEGVVAISSTHNFCPLPVGVSRAAPNLFEPSSPQCSEREQWVHHTRRSIDFAARVRARALVCHLGRVKFPWFNPAGRLERALSKRSRSDPTLAGRALAKLRRRLPAFWEHVQTSVGEVLAYAKERGITLAFENRERFDELPVDADFEGFLAGLPSESAGYWHDTGHAEIKERMGLLEHRAHLARLAARTVGFHLHDVNTEGRDHQAIGEGTIDFANLKPFWRQDHLLTIELGPRVTIDGVRTSKAHVEALLP